jgi:hypothetical protein
LRWLVKLDGQVLAAGDDDVQFHGFFRGGVCAKVTRSGVRFKIDLAAQ